MLRFPPKGDGDSDSGKLCGGVEQNFSTGNYGGQFKCKPTNSCNYEQQHKYVAFRGISRRIRDFDSDYHIYSYYDSELPIRRGCLTPFFIRPKLEVDILPRGPPPHEISSGIQQEVYLDLGIGSIPDITSQCLMLKAKNYGIPRLGAVMWLNGAGPCHMRWKMPETRMETAKREDKEFLTRRYVESPRHIRVVKDEKVFLFVWFAYRRGKNENLTINADPLLTKGFAELGEPFMDIEIQFVPVEKKPRKYRLNIKSWDDLCLTEQP